MYTIEMAAGWAGPAQSPREWKLRNVDTQPTACGQEGTNHRQSRGGQRKDSPHGRPGAPSFPEIPVSSIERHQQRVEAQQPVAWAEERIEDVAIFDDAALASLSSEMQEQATAVRAALKAACESNAESALSLVAGVPRSSPYSDWRLFLRGLVKWFENDLPASMEAWSRLDESRRPARIAAVMTKSQQLQMPVAEANKEEQPQTALTGTANHNVSRLRELDRLAELDEVQSYHAKLLYRIRVDRPALRIARLGLSVQEGDSEAPISLPKLDWLHRFVKGYQAVEPQLTVAIADNARQMAANNEELNVFLHAAKLFPGTLLDPSNRLLTYFYGARFHVDHDLLDTNELLNEFFESDLFPNQAILPAVKGAAAGELIFRDVEHMMDAHAMMPRPKEKREIAAEICDCIGIVLKLYPRHRDALVSFSKWLLQMIESDVKVADRKVYEDVALEVMRTWATAFPTEMEPRLWLVDALLEREQLEEVKPHIEFLTSSRQESPLARATPWKWNLLEASRLCRRKTWFAQVLPQLDQAEKCWPTWLSNEWLPYLRAAAAWRIGGAAALTEAQQTLGIDYATQEGIGLRHSCMLYSAALFMRVPAAELKPLRETLDKQIATPARCTDLEVCRTGAFLWDLNRAKLMCSGLERTKKNFAKMFAKRYEKSNRIVNELKPDPLFQSGLLFCADQQMFSNRGLLRLPNYVTDELVETSPRYLAIKTLAFIRQDEHWGYYLPKDCEEPLRAAAEKEPDAFYRNFYLELAQKFKEVIEEVHSPRHSMASFFEVFESMRRFDE